MGDSTILNKLDGTVHLGTIESKPLLILLLITKQNMTIVPNLDTGHGMFQNELIKEAIQGRETIHQAPLIQILENHVQELIWQLLNMNFKVSIVSVDGIGIGSGGGGGSGTIIVSSSGSNSSSPC